MVQSTRTRYGNNEDAELSELVETAVAKETNPNTENVYTPEPTKEQASAIEPLITKAGGLGDDTKEAIEQVRGTSENEKDDLFSSYQNNTVLIMYAEDDVSKKNTANNVTLSFENTDSPRRTAEEALHEVSSIIPSDAVIVREYTADESRDVVQYESKDLALQMKGYYDFATTLDPEAKPGTFIVILKHDDEGIFSVVVGIGSNP